MAAIRALGLAALLMSAGTLGDTKYWHVARQDGFLQGKELDGVVVTSRGELKVGTAARTLALPDEPSAWSGLLQADGTLYVGTGRGKIYRIQNEEAKEVFDTGAVLVTSIVEHQGELFASTLSGGKIFKMSKTGEWKEHVKLEMDQVWCLAVAPDGTLYAGGGKPAKVFRIAPDGQAKDIYSPRCDFVMTLSLVEKEHLLVGTMNPAQVVRLRGRAGEALFDFGDGEIRSIVQRDGVVYAAYNAKTGAMPHEVLKGFIPKPPPKKEEKKKEEPKKEEPKKEEEKKPGPISFDDDDITGTWEGKITLMGQAQELTMELKNESGKVTGKLKSKTPAQEQDVDVTGTYDAQSKTITLNATQEQQIGDQTLTIKITIEAKVIEADLLKGTFKVEVTGLDKPMSGEFEAKRTRKPAEAKPEKPGDDKPEGGGKPETPEEGGPQEEGPVPPQQAPVPNLSQPPRSGVWSISPSRTEQLAGFNSYVSEIAWWRGSLLVATNDRGRVVRLFPDRTQEIFLGFGLPNVLGFHLQGDALKAVRLGDPGKIGWVSDAPPVRPTYVSSIFDAGYLAHWASLEVRGTGAVEIRTRSGIVARNDDDFGEWSAPLKTFPSKVASPKGRFIQFKILFRDPKAVVEGVSLAYRNENRRPALANLRVDYQPVMQMGQPVVPMGGGGGGSSPQVGQPHSPIKRISWAGQDPDGDILGYRVFVKREGAASWIPITAEDPLLMNMFQWNTEGVPDGVYVVRVAVSDRASNADPHALGEEAVSAAILIDNTRPAVRLSAAAGGKVSGSAVDETSRVASLEISVDGGRWEALAPKDGVFDSKTEEFEIDLSSRRLSRGQHTLTVRALDQEMNSGVASMGFTR